ncbi:MAG: hypothetical protein H7Y36_05140 [Armatimonadetes bacterium]|nr:hypothetical protein [Akkermansiaceae bacterium]
MKSSVPNFSSNRIRWSLSLVLGFVVIIAVSGCSYFVPEYANPISKKHEKEKKQKEEQSKEAPSTPN